MAAETKTNGIIKEPLPSFMKNKFEHIFHLLYDLQHDKNLSRQDFMKLKKKLVEMGNIDDGSEKCRIIQSRIDATWTGLMKGSRIYRTKSLQKHVSVPMWVEYWTDFYEAAKAKGDWPESSLAGNVDYQWHSEFVNLIFDAMDFNGDGVIDRDEYTTFMKAFAYKEQGDTDKSFTVLCQKNGDKLDKNYFTKLWYQYLTSENLDDTPGNYLFGSSLS
ncbi:uncharacterized protein LOC115215832 [Argonauta hians]